MTSLMPENVSQLTLAQSAKARALKAFKVLLGNSGQEGATSSSAIGNGDPGEGTKLGAIFSRAQARLAEETVRSQENREEVGRRAFEELSQSENSDTSDAAIEDDWLNIFGKHAENASGEMLRDLWAKILAGEVRQPGSFSLSTLRLVSELDRQIASTFQNAVEKRFSNGTFLLKPAELKGNALLDLIFLEEMGLLQQVAGIGGLQLKQTINEDGVWTFNEGPLVIIGKGEANKEFSIEVIKITRIGQEIARILPYDPLISLQEIASNIEENFHELSIARLLSRSADLTWQYNVIQQIK